MTRETMENILIDIVNYNLSINSYLTSEEVIEIFEKYCESSEDLDEITEIIFNSKRINYVLLQNGEGYLIGTKRKNWDCFFTLVEISDRDEVWNEFFYYNNSSEKLRDIWEEVKNV